MVFNSIESAEVTNACDAKEHATLHNYHWRLIHSIIRGICHGKILAFVIILY